jgi:hypothetical protein
MYSMVRILGAPLSTSFRSSWWELKHGAEQNASVGPPTNLWKSRTYIESCSWKSLVNRRLPRYTAIFATQHGVMHQNAKCVNGRYVSSIKLLWCFAANASLRLRSETQRLASSSSSHKKTIRENSSSLKISRLHPTRQQKGVDAIAAAERPAILSARHVRDSCAQNTVQKSIPVNVRNIRIMLSLLYFWFSNT